MHLAQPAHGLSTSSHPGHVLFRRATEESAVAIAVLIVAFMVAGIIMCCCAPCCRVCANCDSDSCSNCLAAWDRNCCCCCPKVRDGTGGTATIYTANGMEVGMRGSTEAVRELSERPDMVVPGAEASGDGQQSGMMTQTEDDEEELPTYRPRSIWSANGVDGTASPSPLNDMECVEDADIAEPPPAYASTFPRTQHYHMHTLQPMQRERHTNL